MEDLYKKIMEWLANGETGLSSRTIAFKMIGITDSDTHGSCPSDPSDFKRCLKLINRIPEIRARLNEMRPISKHWNALIDNWDRLEKCFMDEVGGWLIGKDLDKRATKTYDMMQAIYKNS